MASLSTDQIADAVMYIHRMLGNLGFRSTLKEFERELEAVRHSEAEPEVAEEPQAASGQTARQLHPPLEGGEGSASASASASATHRDPRADTSSTADSPAPEEPDEDQWRGESDLGFLVADGTEDELWGTEALDPAQRKLPAPHFPNGAGVTFDQYAEARGAADGEGSAEGSRCGDPRDPDEEEREAALAERKANRYSEVVEDKPESRLEQFHLPVIYMSGRTGFEEDKDFPVENQSIIAGRYQVIDQLGSAVFSKAVQCEDLKTHEQVAVKIIKNNKDFFDQSLDEIKLLQLINRSGDADENCVLQLFDYFYYKEHLFIVSELLRDNLYEFSKYNRECGGEPYFTVQRLQKITKQVLVALAFIHSLGLMHCDLKPENILIRSFSRCEVKVIDFGSSCYTTDLLSSYVQSRCYRAPEVVLGTTYGQKIDLWSLGAILPELHSGAVIFQNDSLPTMLARITAICGPLPQSVVWGSRHGARFVTRHGVWYERRSDGSITLFFPKRTSVRQRMRKSKDDGFIDFVTSLLDTDPAKRPTAREALRHPWLAKDYGPIPAPV
eukprot:TRINITY_DN2898_c2_g1_i2.p1 TRINITY_DN2898_c2_g1~~TRINITY_DN2898_c2_g1_i2.p1  ORF type:complete len:556 (+),score=84.77 TRINITY_DN2898_c2_g1_i2:367-2034(+)